VELLEERCLPSAGSSEPVVPAAGQGSSQAVPPESGGIVFLGDSILANFANGDGAPVWNQEVAPLGALDLAVPGVTTEQVLWLIANGLLANVSPHQVVLLIGTNNLTQGESPEQTALGIAACVSAIQYAQPQADILLLGLLPRGQSPDDPFRAAVARTNTLVASLAQGNVNYADLGPTFLEADGTASIAVLYDFAHLTPLGYAMLGSALEPLLEAPQIPGLMPGFPYPPAAVGWTVLTGDWDGDGAPDLAVVDTVGDWYLQLGSGGHFSFRYGLPGWVPVAGDWAGTGHTGIGIFDPSTGTWYLRAEAGPGPPDLVFQYGLPGWVPVAGDWAGTGHTGIGIFDPATGLCYLRNEAGPGRANWVV
jgi:beta-glucosidase